MAHKKGQGSTRNGRDSESKRLGVKLYGGQFAIAGNIIVRQRGTKFQIGEGVGLGKDHTIYALRDGIVSFRTKKDNKKFVSVLPIDGVEPVEAKKPAKKAKKEKPAAKASKAAVSAAAVASAKEEATESSAKAAKEEE